MRGASSGADQRRAPARIRLFVFTFLIAFIVCGLVEIEAWPLTGWRLFSHLRHERTSSLQAKAVDASGAETAFPFGALPAGYHWPAALLGEFDRSSAVRRAAVCGAWLAAARRTGLDVVTIRIYRVERVVSERVDGRGVRGPSTLEYRCGADVLDRVAPG